ncbi:MAG: tetratricopeptide repeat protein [Armatimonadota bacterium]
MKLLALSGKILLAVGSLAIGLTIYLLSPAARIAPIGYWTAIGVYIVAAELAWILAERQAMQRPNQLRRCGQKLVTKGSFRKRSDYEVKPAVLSDPFLQIGSDADIERDIQASFINTFDTGGKDNRYHLLVGRPGIGKTTLLYRIGSELLERGYGVSTFDGSLLDSPPEITDMQNAARGTARLFVLVDDIHLQPGVGKLLELTLDKNHGITVLGTCTRSAYDVMVRGNVRNGASPRDILSVAQAHGIRITPREGKSVGDKLKRHYGAAPDIMPVDRTKAAGAADEMLSLSVGLMYGMTLPVFAVAVAEDIPPDARRWLIGLSIISLGHDGLQHDMIDRLMASPSAEALEFLKDENVVAEYDDIIYGPHPVVATTLLKSPTLTTDTDTLEISAKIVHRALEIDHTVAASILRGFSHHLGPDTSQRLWHQTRDGWMERITELPPIQLIECFVPMLQDLGENNLITDICEEHLETKGVGKRAAFLRGLALYRLGSFTAARAAFTEFLEEEPYTDMARLNTALCDLSQGRYKPAGRYLEALADEDRDMPGLQYLLGYLAELQGETDRAMDLYKEARAQYTHDRAALSRRAALKIRSGAPKEAVKLYEAGLQQNAEEVDFYGGLAVAHYMAGEKQRAVVQSARAIQAGIDPAVARKTVARAYMDHGIYDLAAGEIDNCLAYSPDDAEARMLLGQCRFNQNDLDAAEEIFAETTGDFPDLLSAQMEYALCLRDREKFSDAQSMLENITQTFGATAETYILQATIAANEGDEQAMGEAAMAAEKAGDETGWAQFLIARAPTETDMELDYRAAIQLFNQTLVTTAVARDAAAIYHALAICRQAVGDFEQAEQSVRQARKLINGDRHHAEPVFSAIDLRRIPTRQFLRQLQDILDELPKQ